MHIQKHFGSRFYGKAVNISRRIAAAYDAALNKYDVLVLPTMQMKATPLPPADAPRELYVQRALEMIGNTCPFDITHHAETSGPKKQHRQLSNWVFQFPEQALQSDPWLVYSLGTGHTLKRDATRKRTHFMFR